MEIQRTWNGGQILPNFHGPPLLTGKLFDRICLAVTTFEQQPSIVIDPATQFGDENPVMAETITIDVIDESDFWLVGCY